MKDLQVEHDNAKAEHEAVLYGVVQLLKAKGDARAVSVLLNSDVRVDWEQYDNWNGGLYYVSVIIRVDYRTYGQLEDEEREAICKAVSAAAEPILDCGENDTFQGVQIRPHEPSPEGWRSEAAAWVRGDGLTNQGRVRSDNIAAREYDGLLFRSQAEINLYLALKAKGLTFAPLPVFIRGGKTYHRLEPDFLVIKDGFVFQVEVDGDTWHNESPVDAQSRTAPMEYEGVNVRRFRASEVATPKKAQAAVGRLLQWIEKQKRNNR